MKIAVLEPRSIHQKNIIRDVLYGCWCGGKRIAGGTVPPFGALRVATILKNEGHDAIFVDAQAEQLSFEDVVQKLEGTRLVIFSSSVMTINNDSEYIAQLKTRIPGLKVAAYGSFPTFNPKAAVNKGIDYAVRREPEWILRDLSEVLAKGDLDGSPQDVSKINGIAHLDSGSTFQKNPQYSFVENVDSLPPIDLGLLPKKINYFNPLVKHLPYITTSTSYGCPGKCTFCTAPFFQGATLRMQSAEKVLSDIEYYLKGGMKEIYFRDETFTADKDRVIQICKGILERGLKFSWICNARTDCADREMLVWMKKAGCHYVKFGAESGNQMVLDMSSKGITLQQTRNAFRYCNELGLDTHAHFMVGMPGDTHETVEQTIRFAIEINPTTATFGICTPYPGTPLFAKVFYQDKGIGDGAENAAMNRLHVEGEYNHLYCSLNAGDLKKVLKRAYLKFYFRPGYFLKMLKRIRNVNMMRNLIIGGTNIASFTADS